MYNDEENKKVKVMSLCMS